MDRESMNSAQLAGLLAVCTALTTLAISAVEAQVARRLESDPSVYTEPDLPRACPVYLRASACSAPGRPDWALPDGCTCEPWSCWLSPREASGAIDGGDGWWLVLALDCDAALGQGAQTHPPPEVYAVTVECQGPFGKTSCKARASQMTKETKVLDSKPLLRGGFVGVEGAR